MNANEQLRKDIREGRIVRPLDIRVLPRARGDVVVEYVCGGYERLQIFVPEGSQTGKAYRPSCEYCGKRNFIPYSPRISLDPAS